MASRRTRELVPYAVGDFVVCTRYGVRYRGVVTGRSVTYLYPRVHVLDMCVNRKWTDLEEHITGKSNIGKGALYLRGMRDLIFTPAGILKVLPKHKLVPYKLKGLLDGIVC